MGDRLQRVRLPALPTVLLADADQRYREMARDALLEGKGLVDLRIVEDGPGLLAYLDRAGDPMAPRPALIVLETALPGEPGGLDVVRAVKANPGQRRIPIIALGTEDDPAQVARAYDAGVNTYFVKPVTFLALVKLVKVFTSYWLETAELPPAEAA